jgi:outer membrane protein OmpA-like peptidoglycan-associated protein
MTWRREGEQRPASKADAPAPGRPLDPAVRGRMETRLGHDFSSVRVHHGSEAKELHARAFAVGEEVTFAPGQYAPGTPGGDRLLAHELGHVIDARHGATPGAYRAPDDGPIPSGPERPLRPPRPKAPSFGVGSLSLGLGVLDSFAFNGSELTPDQRKQIAELAGRLASLMVKLPGGRITIVGHTDLVGGEQANLDLGRKRAVAVAAALAGAGVPATMMDVSSAGKGTPVVETEGREPRNRRVEVRFAGGAIDEGGLTLGQPEKQAPIWDWSKVKAPPGIPPWWQKTPSPTTPAPQPAPGSMKEGSAGDLAKAVAATSQGKKLIEDAQAKGEKDLGKLTTTDKVVLGTVVGAEAAGVIAGLASDPAARKEVLDFVDGKEIPVPWAPGVKVVPHTKGGAVGGVVTFDIIKIFGGGKK